jgi:light-regulated signal transduction histidine kinase (bacteriophytochrome)
MYLQILDLAADLKRSNRDLDDFAYIASHDLKEPLRSISSFSAFLMEDYHDKLDEEGIRKLNVLISQSARLEKFLTALLQFSRVGREELRYETINPGKIIDEVKIDLDVLIASQSDHPVNILMDTKLPEINSNPYFLKEIYLNLISNGIKYNESDPKEIRLGYLQEYRNFHQVFYVADNGIGIPEKHHQEVFKIFKRLHSRDKYGGGSGAGLTIVRKMIQTMKGTIWIEPGKEKGTIFYFTLKGEES